MTDYKLGVIGGMGPLATSMFYQKLIDHTEAKQDQDHIDTIILNHATLPDRTYAILNHEADTFLQAVRNDFKLLEYAGVTHIAIPCNTSHYFYESMQSMTNIPIIHMVEKTAEAIHAAYGAHSKVGILATNGTINTGIYDQACQKYELEPFHPNETLQQKVMDTIYQIKADPSFDANILTDIITELLEQEACTCIILGCTELSCVPLPDHIQKYCIDPMDVLVKESIRLADKTYITRS
ncbi:amino acid racemase [Ornithinibacillus gellani]|uniref:aspartate/glutamate racemase family protein n=1 Tax=Ornithinibacillus gellani TaxID=2293253 RepID=UPI000F476062|nr:amino acid racemase [Ornithinibacillus gellani]TQS75441.1 amino acid racemase [Ornithinibacillus gellani]